MHVSTIQQFVGFIYGIGLVLSCQIQDDLSLYYNIMSCQYYDSSSPWYDVMHLKNTGQVYAYRECTINQIRSGAAFVHFPVTVIAI